MIHLKATRQVKNYDDVNNFNLFYVIRDEGEIRVLHKRIDIKRLWYNYIKFSQWSTTKSIWFKLNFPVWHETNYTDRLFYHYYTFPRVCLRRLYHYINTKHKTLIWTIESQPSNIIDNSVILYWYIELCNVVLVCAIYIEIWDPF